MSAYSGYKVNDAPDAPSGITADYSYSVAGSTLTVKWLPGNYDGVGKSSYSLYYNVVMATVPMTLSGDSLRVQPILPSTFTVSWTNGTPLMGDYIRPPVKIWPGDSIAKHGMIFTSTITLPNRG